MDPYFLSEYPQHIICQLVIMLVIPVKAGMTQNIVPPVHQLFQAKPRIQRQVIGKQAPRFAIQAVNVF